MYEPRIIKGKAAPKNNYNKNIILILLLPPYPFPCPPLYFFLLPLKPPPFLFPFLLPFLFPPFFPLFLPSPPSPLFLLGQNIYRPRKTNYNLSRNLKTPSKKGYNLPEGFNLLPNFIKASDNFNKASNNLSPTHLLIL